LDPKIFYRKLDALLSKISFGKSGKDFIMSIVGEVESTFGKDLHITNGRIYEEAGNEYILISSSNPEDIKLKKINAISEPVKMLIKNRSYIYNNKEFTIDESVSKNNDHTIPAAFIVRNGEFRYIVIFDLKAGWIRDEIQLCLNAVNASLNQRLISETIKNELQQAASIQQSLLPQNSPDIQGFDIHGRSVAAELVGGDLYDYFLHEDGRFGFVIGDASGHGIPAALLARDVVTGLRMGVESHAEITHVLKKLNRVIYRSVYSTRFISLFYANIENNGNLFYVNAGHPAPLLIKGNDIQELNSTGLIFGALPEIELQREYARMEPGSLIVLYTDGIIERTNSAEDEFGIQKLKDLIIENQHKSAKEINQEIFEVTRKYGNQDKWFDDATVVVIKRL